MSGDSSGPAGDSTSGFAALAGQAARGDEKAVATLFSQVYQELRSIAQQRMNQERPGHTLQATALVHETFLRLIGIPDARWAGRAQFFSAAAEAMRRILIEHARARGRVKRGGEAGVLRKRVPLGAVDLAVESDLVEILALDEAICRLQKEEPEIAEVVRLRFFAGLSIDDTAEVLKLSPRSVDRHWTYARTWLFQALRDADQTSAGES